jgi:phage shock protein PspC (stress-responsive transcriptional regulator)
MSQHEPEQARPEGTPAEPETSEGPPGRGPRRLLRSRDDRVIGGVAGGLGSYFGVDPVFFRVGAVALAFVGGLGVFLYVAALLFVPSEDPSGGEPPRRSRAVMIAGAIALVLVGAAVLAEGGWWFGGFFLGPLGFLLLLGAAVWWLIWGRSDAGTRSSRATLGRIALVLLVLGGSAALFVASFWAAGAGGGVGMAALVIGVGVALALAALRRNVRWLVVPALAVAAGVGLVAAADVDLKGGYGERTYAPSSLAELRDGYDLGAGRLEVDLRGVDVTGDRRLDLELGLGEAVLVVPPGLCVVSDADVGAGYLRVLGWDDGGFNVGWDEDGAASAQARLLVDAHVGLGALQVVHDPDDAEWREDRWDGRGGWKGFKEDDDPARGRSTACETSEA